ncbi:MlaD family protein [Conexibacter arvalis]|uniref:ABC-type transporter Mla subunit MlaD n=1 Tax=Conexibacter arvalis TaxID=912552 RepID=A0A840ICT4_9ACTN|nr:MlaD family protein [Conexibacter arvalis]MBB4662679.1 ABC-type transporter Mla subunit MlaD [Conexibacter arvalis]
MRRLLAIGALVLVVLVALVIGTGAVSDDDSYKIRAVFDNAGFLVPGEDVKVSGVVVGTIDSLDVTPDKKAVVVLEITDPAFRNFKRDARCSVRLQSLLGEKYVACEPTQPKPDGAPQAPPLREIEDGPGEGQLLLPVTNTHSAVDLDTVGNIMRLPEQQRFALILNEFGTGLAGNGEELRAVVRRAFPALDELDELIKILADQNRVLAKLAEDSDAALQPVAREADRISNFIDKAGITAEATAEEGDALERNFELFPRLLRELQPTMARFEEFSRAATPVFADLRVAAPSVNQIFEQLGPFSEAALPTFRTLGDASEITRRALIAARPVIQDIRGLARSTGPLARNLAVGLADLEQQRGIDRFMGTVLGFAGAMNGYDDVSHYLRTFLAIDGTCMAYRVRTTGCDISLNRLERLGLTSAATASAASDDSPSAADDANGKRALTIPSIGLAGPSEPEADQHDAAAGSDTAAADDGAGDATEDPRAGVLGYLLGSEATR